MERGKKDKKANVSDQKENASSLCYSNSPELRPEYRDEGETDPEPNYKPFKSKKK